MFCLLTFLFFINSVSAHVDYINDEDFNENNLSYMVNYDGWSSAGTWQLLNDTYSVDETPYLTSAGTSNRYFAHNISDSCNHWEWDWCAKPISTSTGKYHHIGFYWEAIEGADVNPSISSGNCGGVSGVTGFCAGYFNTPSDNNLWIKGIGNNFYTTHVLERGTWYHFDVYDDGVTLFIEITDIETDILVIDTTVDSPSDIGATKMYIVGGCTGCYNHRVLFDNLEFYEGPLAPSDDSISFNPDIDHYTEDPYLFNFTVDDSHVDELYRIGVFKVMRQGTYQVHDFLGYVDGFGGTWDLCGIHSPCFTLPNMTSCTLELVKYNVYWPDDSVPVTPMRMYTDVLAWDYITVNTSNEPPEPPLPPTPNETQTPYPTETQTPFPTETPTSIPTPDPDPGDNMTYEINSSFMGDYYVAVDGVFDNLTTVTKDGIGFLASPVFSLTEYIITVNDSLNESFSQSVGYKSVLVCIMVPFFSYLPASIQALITLSIIFILILLILRGNSRGQ